MPLDTILCLDTSGSMAGRGMRELKKAVVTFLEGVEETAKECDIKENVAVVEFGKNERIVQELTNDYNKVKRAANGLTAGGRTPMFSGLMKCMEEILEHGGVVKVAGKPLTPRIILMTDGAPTGEKGEGEAKMEVLKAAAAFGPGWKEVGLPHPIPIACVGCGDCDPELLQAIAKLTNGMFVVVDNVEELSGFFKRQVLLIRFATKFGDDLKSLRSLLMLRQFMTSLGEAVDEDEGKAMLAMLLLMMGLEDDDEQGSKEIDSLPTLGSRVRRGKDWKWKDQDKHGVGTVVEHISPGVLRVQWDHGDGNQYRYGAEGSRDVKVVDEPRIIQPGDDIKVGVRVQRGKDWKWDDQDGGSGNTGVVYKVHSGATKGLVQVRWSNGVKADYRHGRDNCYDLKILGDGNIVGRVEKSVSSIDAAGPTEIVEIGDDDDITISTVLPKTTPTATTTVRREPEITYAQVMPITETVMAWRWKDNHQQWRLFDEPYGPQVEESYNKNPKGCTSIKIGDYTYNFDFSAMTQVNQSTKRSRPIRREGLDREEYDLLLALERSLSLS
ncbi:uncharacterized protein LOC102801576 [Saccoglossus kowalevskii]|uniref:Uncharacterized protein LOC102801576 n=1 Tax=Saccoglossus kowalevskii TaxID=10224 RepID=A0ABM0LUD4_SACKO|nr:PREDICTED: uncharacterized protein LOC102801576 [Saccoglossus kowalevskii]